MSSNQQAPKPTFKAQAKSAQASVKTQAEKAKSSAKNFDSKYPLIKKIAVWFNRVLAGAFVIPKALIAAFAICAAAVTSFFALGASVGDLEWGIVVQPLLLTIVFSLLYIWIDKTFSK